MIHANLYYAESPSPSFIVFDCVDLGQTAIVYLEIDFDHPMWGKIYSYLKTYRTAKIGVGQPYLFYEPLAYASPEYLEIWNFITNPKNYNVSYRVKVANLEKTTTNQ